MNSLSWFNKTLDSSFIQNIDGHKHYFTIGFVFFFIFFFMELVLVIYLCISKKKSIYLANLDYLFLNSEIDRLFNTEEKKNPKKLIWLDQSYTESIRSKRNKSFIADTQKCMCMTSLYFLVGFILVFILANVWFDERVASTRSIFFSVRDDLVNGNMQESTSKFLGMKLFIVHFFSFKRIHVFFVFITCKFIHF